MVMDPKSWVPAVLRGGGAGTTSETTPHGKVDATGRPIPGPGETIEAYQARLRAWEESQKNTGGVAIGSIDDIAGYLAKGWTPARISAITGIPIARINEVVAAIAEGALLPGRAGGGGGGVDTALDYEKFYESRRQFDLKFSLDIAQFEAEQIAAEGTQRRWTADQMLKEWQARRQFARDNELQWYEQNSLMFERWKSEQDQRLKAYEQQEIGRRFSYGQEVEKAGLGTQQSDILRQFLRSALPAGTSPMSIPFLGQVPTNRIDLSQLFPLAGYAGPSEPFNPGLFDFVSAPPLSQAPPPFTEAPPRTLETLFAGVA